MGMKGRQSNSHLERQQEGGIETIGGKPAGKVGLSRQAKGGAGY